MSLKNPKKMLRKSSVSNVGVAIFTQSSLKFTKSGKF